MSTNDATRPTPVDATAEPPPVVPSPGTDVGDVNTTATATTAARAVEGVSVVAANEDAVDVAEASARALADTIDGPVVIAPAVVADMDVVVADAAADAAPAAEVSAPAAPGDPAEPAVVAAADGAVDTATVAGAVAVAADEHAPALASAVSGATVIVPVIGEISAPVVEVIVRWKDRLLVALPFISLIFAIVRRDLDGPQTIGGVVHRRPRPSSAG